MNTKHLIIDTDTQKIVDWRYGGRPALEAITRRLNKKEGRSRYRLACIF